MTVELLAHSKHPESGVEIATFRLDIWKVLLAELNTHRKFSRNAASSRAVPGKIMRAKIKENPVIPKEWLRNQSGMQAGEPMDKVDAEYCGYWWRKAAQAAAEAHERLENPPSGKKGLHKQWLNRLLEPFVNSRVIVTSTEWSNFFNLRATPLDGSPSMAQPEFTEIADEIRLILSSSKAEILKTGAWHIPLAYRGEKENLSLESLLKLSAARCAKVSYFREDEELSEETVERICDKLFGSNPVHASPAEHQAKCVSPDFAEQRNFNGGWLQYRHFIENSDDCLDACF